MQIGNLTYFSITYWKKYFVKMKRKRNLNLT